MAFLDFVDASITNVALPHILASLPSRCRACRGSGLPAALSTLTTTFTAARDRQSALGVWAAVAGLSSAVGILLGGALTEGPGWRWAMFVNPIACVLVIPAVLALLPHDRPAALRCCRARRVRAGTADIQVPRESNAPFWQHCC